MKNFFAHPLILVSEIIITIGIAAMLFFSYVKNFQENATLFADGVITEYQGTINRYIASFDVLSLMTKQKIQQNPSVEDLQNWLRSSEASMYESAGQKSFDGFYLTYKGGFARSWTYGDYSKYVPEQRLWYTAAQKAGQGKIVVIPPYTGYANVDHSQKNILLTIARRENDEITMAMDLKLSTVNMVLINKQWKYPDTLTFVASPDGGILCTNEFNYYLHNLNIADDIITPEFSKKLLAAKSDANHLTLEKINGQEKIVFAYTAPTGNTSYTIFPLWNVLRQELSLLFLLTLILIVLEIILFALTRRRQKEINLHQQELQHAKDLAEQASFAKTDFLSRMSHDMRTPLNGIIGMTYLTREMTLPTEAMDNLEKIDTSSKFLLSIINDILDMSKIESNKMTPRPEPFYPEEYENYLDAVILPLCKEKNQKLIVHIDVPKDFISFQDKLFVSRISFNLLSNACKYTPEGGTITCSITGKVLPGNKQMSKHVEICDNGIGMSEAFQKVMFETFTQENRVDSEKHGTGLGLPIVKKLMDLIHGTITVKSQLGQGTTFYLDIIEDCLPISQVPQSPNVKVDALDINKILSGKHILLCEDHPLNQRITVELLKKKGVSVTTADDGQIGLKHFQLSALNYYDLILMDIRMPVMDGYEATKAIRNLARADAKTVPIIGLSANAFTEDIEKGKAAGMNDYLPKPFDPKVLFATIAKYVQ